ncbi:MAG: FAD-dependent monooxygenase [Hyphomicrobiales bacterium]
MAASAEKSVTIVGAGIAGITTALCLKQHSIPVKIIEKRANIATAGAGIQITPNAFRILDRLGLGERIKTSGHTVNHLSVCTGRSNTMITRMPLGTDFERTHDAPYLVLKRQALIGALYEQAVAQDIDIHFNTKLAQTDGIIIGADGVWSSLRQQVNSVEASFSGRTAFRCMIAANQAPKWTATNDLAMWLGNNAHFAAYPVDEKGTLNLVCVVKDKQPEKRWSTRAAPSDILHHLKDWNDEIISLVQKGENWQRWPLYTVEPKQSWSRDNKVLIGDAAHAMVPFLAQGGAMAIEDAATLAHAIAKKANMNDAFAAYQSLRKERITRVWNEAKANGERYHWSGMMARTRDLGLKALGGKRLQQRYNWIYEWQPPS